MSIYVEIRIRGSMEDLWQKTQVPNLHEQWDLRFTDIEYLPRPEQSAPQRFLYATRIGFGLSVRGGGESVGSLDDAQGCRTSALKFWSDDPKSLIREGAGYWQYIPTGDGIRFLTSYDYRVRCGFLGRVFDALVFRPLLGWATAWSFDRLRLWVEKGIDPGLSLRRSVVHALARTGVGFVWLYQGIVPKLLCHHADELLLLRQAGFSSASAPAILSLVGWLEVALGLAVLTCSRSRWPFLLTIALMMAATLDVAVHSPGFLVTAFNAVSLNASMIALAAVGLASSTDVPTARRCLRRRPENGS